MVQKKAKPTHKVVQDVAPLDTTEADSSSKPIIVTHRPLVQDPMVNADTASAKTSTEPTDADVAEAKPELKSPSQSRKIIAPTPAEAAEVMAVTTPDAKPDANDTNAADDTTGTDKADDSLTVDGLATPDKKHDAKRAAERAANLDELVENHTYYLPINQVEKRRNKRYAILGLFFIIILGIAWLDVSLDSGILTIPGIDAPTHFFR